MNRASTLFTNTNYASLSLSPVLVTLLKTGIYVPRLHSSELLEDVFRRVQGGPIFSQTFLPDVKSISIVQVPNRMHSSSKKMFNIELVPEEHRTNTTMKTAFTGSIKVAVIISSKNLVGTEPSIYYIHK